MKVLFDIHVLKFTFAHSGIWLTCKLYQALLSPLIETHNGNPFKKIDTKVC